MEKTVEHQRGAAEQRTRTLVLTGLLAALGCVGTMVLTVPSPTGGYMNLGDAVVLLGAYLLGPVWGAVAGGVGPALADLLAGYVIYAPATLVIKALMGVTAALLYRRLRDKPGALVICGVAAEVIMVAGYCLYDAILAGNPAGGLAGIPSNLVQAGFGIAASALLTLALRRSSYVRREFPSL
ncbi:ECF transporter S component [Oscillibacter sp.]|uniref:ECF transporter S component n=1 Tax=Oscillibacter sp. TaxID=1945593 RepID=UPI0026285C8C|nr:ECF transporter S component [Oscillibacter sp.]MDD3346351.1 ECF transporter S component [Oscillibacter sp.]